MAAGELDYFGTDELLTDEERMIRQLWPDQETYRREEQRRFEILLAHWDLPVTDLTPARK